MLALGVTAAPTASLPCFWFVGVWPLCHMATMNQSFAIGQHVEVGGEIVEVMMETATQLLVRPVDSIGGKADRWVPRASVAGGNSSSSSSQQQKRAPQRGSAASPNPGQQSAVLDEPEDDECFVCGQAGKLTCCDVCPRVYHLRCLPAADAAQLRKAGAADEDWWCPRCRHLVRLTFAMSRELSHPAVGEPGECDEVALRLYSFLSDAQHDSESWDSLRDAGSALLHAMPNTPPWRTSLQPPAEIAALHAAELLAARVDPTWWSAGVKGSSSGGGSGGGSGGRGRDAGGSLSHSASEADGFEGGDATSSAAEEGGGAHSEGGGTAAAKASGATTSSGGGRNRSSEYRGVSRRYGKWKARIRNEGTDIIIGDFENEIDAARAYDKKAKIMHGDKAQLNFPEK